MCDIVSDLFCSSWRDARNSTDFVNQFLLSLGIVVLVLLLLLLLMLFLVVVMVVVVVVVVVKLVVVTMLRSSN